ncbi:MULTISPECIES: IS701-like element ISMch7 family transposase [Methylorubrum]|uniref:Transposase n=1 Tax=Methylorubrum extorquens (strain CM4 / NCIMB 13688) TaxID=440085 RepID=B7L3E5_METC4|nr:MULTISPECIES: IS701-like element ISMch7 family transposase [Methylorubrum]ACK86353.1 transposase [Methylorubrum extorquens CM4]MBK3403002.1 IS701-like element ISMch7 family transposase [Methylorubrum rhodesianum]MBY0142164.1 IS701-like element ISMch7 family transposase [Methylorubrum populi]
MPSASLESTLELWSTTLRQTKQRIRPLFAAPSVAASANAFLDGLLGGERRKTGWMRAEAAGDPGPWRQQAILGRTHWDAEALRDVVRDDVVETLASPDAVLVIDETGFLKQGKASCGVGRQYTGSAGKITNCQIGVFASYVSDQGHAFIDRRLYLPKAWTEDPARLRAAHVPEAVAFATKPRLALAMIERAVRAEVPFAWVAADSIYGVGEIELALRRAYKGYVLGVTGQHRFWSWDANLDLAGTAENIAKGISDQDWLRLSAGAGTKGARLFDWAYLPLATLRADALDAALDQSLWTRGLLVRRSLSDGALAYFTTWCPAGTPVEKLVMVEGRRWAIEDAFETAKTELGLAHNESRSWHGWHRHVSLVMLAFAMLARVRRLANGPPPKTTLIAKLAGAVVHSGDPARGDAAGATAH